MKIFYVVLAVAAAIGGFVGGWLTGTTFSALWAILGPILVGGAIFCGGWYFDNQEKKKKQKELPPEVRDVFDRMTGKKPYS